MRQYKYKVDISPRSSLYTSVNDNSKKDFKHPPCSITSSTIIVTLLTGCNVLIFNKCCNTKFISTTRN